jgi:class 3 adenylate cyclase/tetratricopeptide (TPR) repeat protein
VKTESEIRCGSCQAAASPGQRFCGSCGAPLAASPLASTPAQAEARSGPTAAEPAPDAYTPAHIARMILGSRSALEGERKQVTVLFCDLAGSTTIAEQLGADTMHEVLQRFFELALAEVHRYEGTVNQFLGDGLMALFGAPVAHEDHARRAVLAALGIQRAIAEHRADFHGADLRLRIGLNTGPVVVGKIGDNLRMDYTAVGDTTNLASRVQGLAEPGWAYATAATHELVADGFDWEPLGERRVKGRQEAVTVYRTSGHRAPGMSTDTRSAKAMNVHSPLVGREAELATLGSAIEAASSTGTGRIVAIIGEPGLGKSRLLLEARGEAESSNVLWLEGRALSFGQTLSYWPFLDLIRRWLGVTEETPSTDVYAALRTRLGAMIGAEADDLLPYLATMLGLTVEPALEDRVRFLDGQAMGLQIFRSARRFVERLAADRTVVLVFEDLHWADASTTELLEHLLPLTRSVPLVLIGTSRPDRQTAAARLAEVAARDHPERYDEIRLRPLAQGADEALVAHLLDGAGAADLRRRVIARAEGNPYFAEEVVRSLISSGAVVRDETSGGWRSTDRAEAISIPGTVQGVIVARVDRLDDDVKQVLKVASVIGRAFLYRVLDAVDDAGVALDHHLAGLQQLELIRERRRQPELEFLFSHALVQEATYDSILVDRRRRLHLAVATAIESLFPDRLDEFAGILAHHFTAAEEWDRAQHYLFRAGDQAGRLAGDTEALARYRQAIDVYAKVYGDRWDPFERAVLERKVGEAVFGRGDFDTALEHFTRALGLLGAPYPRRQELRRRIGAELARQMLRHPLGRRLGSYRPGPVDRVLEERCRLYYLIGWMDLFRDQEQLTLDVLLQLNTAEQGAGPAYVVRGAMSLGIMFDILGQPRTAARYHDWARRLAEEIDHPVARADSWIGVAYGHMYAGRVMESQDAAYRAADAYGSAGQIHDWGGGIGTAMHIERYTGRLDQMRVDSAKVLRAGDEAGDAMLRGWGHQGTAFAMRVAGEIDAAVEHLDTALSIYRPVPSHGSIAEATADLAMCRLAQGRLDDAVTLAREAVATLDAHALRNFEGAAPRSALVDALDARGSPDDLEEARRAAEGAVKHAQRFGIALPNAMRVSASNAWLRGDTKTARARWRTGLDGARASGTRFDEARLLLDLGRLGGDADAVAQGERILEDIRTSWRGERT